MENEKIKKIRRSFMIYPSTLEKLKEMADMYDFSINNMLERCILNYNHNTYTGRNLDSLKKPPAPTCILKYGQSWKNK